MAKRSERSLEWQGLEHHHTEKGRDWFWAVGIIALAGTITSILLGNILFAIVIVLASATLMVAARRVPQTITYGLTPRGVRVGEELYRYDSLESFCIDEDEPAGPQLYLKSERLLSPLIVVPLPDEHVDAVDALLREKIAEEHLEESVGHRLLEFLGF